jgi:hypothetical protein
LNISDNRLAVVVGQLQSTIADLVSEVREMSRKLDRALHQNSATHDDSEEKEMQLIGKLPLNCLEEFDELEVGLREVKFHNLLVSCN